MLAPQVQFSAAAHAGQTIKEVLKVSNEMARSYRLV